MSFSVRRPNKVSLDFSECFHKKNSNRESYIHYQGESRFMDMRRHVIKYLKMI